MEIMVMPASHGEELLGIGPEYAGQLAAIDLRTLYEQILMVRAKRPEEEEPLAPYRHAVYSGSEEKILLGKASLQKGFCGCLVVAGGQGTRLKFAGAKGRFPTSVVQKKSLFQMLSEKVLAASRQLGQDLPLAIMTSPENDSETRRFFKDHHFFGLKASQIDFFTQGTLPFLDEEGKLLINPSHEIAQGPDGNGSSLGQFYTSGLWQKWQDQGVRALSFIQIDNPLADPYDAELFGYHFQEDAEITVKAIPRSRPEERVGVLVEKQGKLQVVEYSEIHVDKQQARDANGELLYPFANISSFCISMDFIKRLQKTSLPLHRALKPVQTLKGAQMAWKFERFIFDILPFADVSRLLIYPRERSFAPLKNAEGEDSLPHVQQQLQSHERRLLFELTGRAYEENKPLELAAQFYYPTPELAARWQSEPFPKSGYCE